MVTELSAKPAFSLSGTAQSGAADYPGLDNWRDLPISQQPSWQDRDVFEASVKELSVLPPLVFAGEVDVLRERLAAAAQGKAFLLQGGDCAETFEAATADKISARV
ncbi:MAG: 3-deoxy-7-phosphoheptulonate synthase, partial [Actinomycetes bacterium]